MIVCVGYHLYPIELLNWYTYYPYDFPAVSVETMASTKIAKTPRSTSIKHRSDTTNTNQSKTTMTSSNGSIFRVTGHLCREFTGPRLNSPHKGQRGGALMSSLICAWIYGWVNNREADDLRRHRAHYDVTVMTTLFCRFKCFNNNITSVALICRLYNRSTRLFLLNLHQPYWSYHFNLSTHVTTSY